MKRMLLYSLCILSYTTIQTGAIENLLNQAQLAITKRNAPEAIMLLQDALYIEPHHEKALQELAKVFYYTSQFNHALETYQHLYARNPSSITANYNLGCTYLKIGDLHKALELFEYIDQKNPQAVVTTKLLKAYITTGQWDKAEKILNPRLWWYDENIYGKKILLNLDKEGNGLGDAIQFIRYAQQLNQAGAQVFVRVHEPLKPLFSRCPYIRKVLTSHDPDPIVDKTYNICIASLIIQSKFTQLNNAAQPYLAADPELILQWSKSIHNKKYNIGVAWQSNLIVDPWTRASMAGPRSFPPEILQPIAQHSNIQLYSLQKQSTASANLNMTTFDESFDSKNGRFMDTAALMKNLDLVITTDTSIAHLAGALHVPVWVLLPIESDYRWFSERPDSPWYPTMRLFRQKTYGQWNDTIEQVIIELTQVLKPLTKK